LVIRTIGRRAAAGAANAWKNLRNARLVASLAIGALIGGSPCPIGTWGADQGLIPSWNEGLIIASLVLVADRAADLGLGAIALIHHFPSVTVAGLVASGGIAPGLTRRTRAKPAAAMLRISGSDKPIPSAIGRVRANHRVSYSLLLRPLAGRTRWHVHSAKAGVCCKTDILGPMPDHRRRNYRLRVFLGAQCSASPTKPFFRPASATTDRLFWLVAWWNSAAHPCWIGSSN